MKTRYLMSLLATAAFLPAVAHAQVESGDACERLLQSLPQDSSVSRAQIEQFRANDNNAACQTVLNDMDPSAAGANPTAMSEQPGRDASGAEITVDGGTASIAVEQAAPQITVEQAQSEVTVQQGQPEVIIHQPAPRISIEIPPPQITFRMPAPEVNVNTPEPQVSVNQAEPEVRVVSTPDDGTGSSASPTNMSNAPQPIVRFEVEDAQVEVTQSEQPNVRFEQAASNDRSLGGSPDATAASSAGDEILVSRIEGMPLGNGDGSENLGVVTAVIVDAQDRPFVIIDREGEQFAVILDSAELRGDRLVLIQATDPSQLPRWTESRADSDEIRELGGNDTVPVRNAT